MPRLARLDAPGVLHYIMIRGIERRNIFRVKKDREDFLERLSKLIPETQTCRYAWVLMSNHAHLLLRSLFCYWAAKELEVSLTELSRRIGISVPAVGYSVERGSIIAKENNYKLIEDKT